MGAIGFSNNPFDTGGTGGGGTGPQGPPGLPGTPATVAVGAVTAGPLAVTNSGTASAAVLDFSIPAAEGVTISTNTPPAAPDPGDLWTTLNGQLYIWRGSFWVQII